jgi:hypothetical protein
VHEGDTINPDEKNGSDTLTVGPYRLQFVIHGGWKTSHRNRTVADKSISTGYCHARKKDSVRRL